ncbi:hypothetical protein MARI_13100 [Marinobacter sp. JH2]|nr:hypothetical protein MARI_13100 [Marinobacter sp. JH2]
MAMFQLVAIRCCYKEALIHTSFLYFCLVLKYTVIVVYYANLVIFHLVIV